MSRDLFFGRVASAFVFISIAGARAGALDEPRYNLSVDRSEARNSLSEILENLQIRKDRGITLNSDELRGWSNDTLKLLRTYRDHGNADLTIRNAPFPGLLVATVVPALYPVTYDSTYESEFEITVRQLDSERIFDAFMSGVVADRIPDGMPDDITRAAKQIGKCLAAKAVKAKAPTCELDRSGRVIKHGKLELLWAKIDCAIHFNSVKGCKVRRTLFDVAQPLIEKAKSDPAINLRAIIEREFNQAFPENFRKEFLIDLGQRAGSYADLVVQKFKGSKGEFWNADAPLVEGYDRDKNLVRTSGFGKGISSDVSMAALLLNDSDPHPDQKMRGKAAALFYAAANRLLVMTGGDEAAYDHKLRQFQLAEGDQFDPTAPKRAPKFYTTPFGGWSLDMTRNGPAFQTWNWVEYDPRPPTSPLRLFPEIFELKGRGIARPVRNDSQIQSLGDLSELLRGLSTFLKLTRTDGVFGPYFGKTEDMAELFRPTSPIVFPKTGRLLGSASSKASRRISCSISSDIWNSRVLMWFFTIAWPSRIEGPGVRHCRRRLATFRNSSSPRLI